MYQLWIVIIFHQIKIYNIILSFPQMFLQTKELGDAETNNNQIILAWVVVKKKMPYIEKYHYRPPGSLETNRRCAVPMINGKVV